MTAAINKKKERADEVLKIVGELDETTKKAIYIATKMFLAKKDAEESKEEKAK